MSVEDIEKKYLDLYNSICELVYSIDKYKDQIQLLYKFKQEIDFLEKIVIEKAKTNMTGRIKLDNIQLKDSVYISDPCYDIDTDCQAKVDNILPGEYLCFSNMSYISDTWKFRVQDITIINKDYYINEDILDKLIYEHLDEEIGVDSGQCGIFDSEYYKEKHKDDLDEDWYTRIFDITDDYFSGTIDNLGLVSVSGYGDGTYTAYVAKNTEGKVISIKVIFIDNENADK